MHIYACNIASYLLKLLKPAIKTSGLEQIRFSFFSQKNKVHNLPSNLMITKKFTTINNLSKQQGRQQQGAGGPCHPPLSRIPKKKGKPRKKNKEFQGRNY